ncbi:uncharacterized protein LOC126316695 [Schistocerca gregaria]|uniref:uncharacterized protein LOC126316695 n=1 Tax=Schistocerca gregaria TaxID=7010 RepID=UPI00211E2125|nr:uncharacterized protein LOC126316695 [Schistocerca gregaria]
MAELVSADAFFEELNRLAERGEAGEKTPNDFYFQCAGRSNSFVVHQARQAFDAGFAEHVPVYASILPEPTLSTFEPEEELREMIDFSADEQVLLPLEEQIGEVGIDYTSLCDVSVSRASREFDIVYDYRTGEILEFRDLELPLEASFVDLPVEDWFRDRELALERDEEASGEVESEKEDGSTSRRRVKMEKLFDLSKQSLMLPKMGFGICYDGDEGTPTILGGEDVGAEEAAQSETKSAERKKSFDTIYQERQEEKARQEAALEKIRGILREGAEKLDGGDEQEKGSPSVVIRDLSRVCKNNNNNNNRSEEMKVLEEEEEFLQNLKQEEIAAPLEWLSLMQKKATKEKSSWAVMTRMENILVDWQELVPEPAIIYPFEMDEFQKEAAYHLENGESVFIAAHTSAGKTVVAEYAIALTMKHMTRAIYTSPIKALSNQKYRDFMYVFGDDVGIVTGDVSVRSEASCLVVTVEILRSMLYKGADLVRDVEWVIFDEVHYVNDLERGVVWEETIIMLPDHINLIFLSATVPNTFEFADWVGRTKKKPIYVITTDRRPVPLEHYLYFDKNLHKIADANGYLPDGYKAAAKVCAERNDSKPNVAFRQSWQQERGGWCAIVQMLKKKQLLPAVTFVLSRKKCMFLAGCLASVDLTVDGEKQETIRFIRKCLKRLKGADSQLPQVLILNEMLQRGIGVHHSGLLPIIKEMVEILFSRGLVKILFATETFAMGVNMPARTVLFSSIRKNDGQQFRDLYPGEYIQMSGRAGRRGSDTVGTVIIVCDNQLPEPTSLRRMISGRATKLESQFRITYNMILNVLKMGDGFRIEDMIKRSFFESYNQKDSSNYQERLKRIRSKIDNTPPLICKLGYGDPAPMVEYYELTEARHQLNKQIQAWLIQSNYFKEMLCPGRVVVISNHHSLPRNALGVIVRTLGEVKFCRELDLNDEAGLSQTIRVLALTGCPSRDLSKQYRLVTIRVTAGNLELVTQRKFKKIDPELIDVIGRESYIKDIVNELTAISIECMPGLPEPLNFSKTSKIKSPDFVELTVKLQSVEDSMLQNPCHHCKHRTAQYKAQQSIVRMHEYAYALEYILSDTNLLMFSEYEARIKVLKKLNYIDKDGFVQIKGRVARELNSCDELVATELIFDNVLTDLTPAETAAILSSLVFEQKTTVDPIMPTANLITAKNKLFTLARELTEIEIDCGLAIQVHDYKKRINIGLIEVVYNWAQNKPFQDILKLTDVLEGNIVRTIVRLDETCRDFKSASRIIGDVDLCAKIEEASNLIKHGIVFANSLYLTEHQQSNFDGSASAD